MTSEAIGEMVGGLRHDLEANCNKRSDGILQIAQVQAMFEIAYQLAVMNERNAAKDAAAVNAPGFEWTPPIGNIMELDPQS